MPVPIPAGALAQFILRGTLHGQLVMSTWLYELDTAVPDDVTAMDTALPTFIEAVWTGNLQPLLSQDLNTVVATGQWVWPQRLAIRNQVPALNAGAVSTAAAPSGAAFVVRRLTDFAGRHYRGRVFIPGIPIANVLNSQLSPGWVVTNRAAVEFIMVQTLNAGATERLKPVVGNYKTLPLPATKSVTPVTGAFLDSVIRYQRRREVGVGV